MKRWSIAVQVAAMITGVAAVGSPPSAKQHILSSKRGSRGAAFTETHEISDASSDPVADGMKGNSLGMKGQGFQAGFVGSMPAFGELKFPGPYAINDMRCVTGKWRVGCMDDIQTKQQIWYRKEVAKEDQVPMTPELCFWFCRNVSGVQFMGLRNGDECYCTPFFQQGPGGKGECDMPCTGDNSRMCGGQTMSDVYEMHDCKNLPPVNCMKPPLPVDHARVFDSKYYRAGGNRMQVPCKNAVNGPLSSANSYCQIECDYGYEMRENDYKCEERGNPLTYSWGQMVGLAQCTPVVCGIPHPALHSKRPMSKVEYPNLAHYTCDTGYTLNGNATGVKQFTTRCQGDATFTDTQECKPVWCGKCPLQWSGSDFFNAKPAEQNDRYYQDQCNFLCDHGYTLNGQAFAGRHYHISCMASGAFTTPPQCLPVVCGNPPQFVFTGLSGHFGKDDSVVFSEVIGYTCEEGYTLNQAGSGPKDFEVECTATGAFSEHKECKPVLCGPPPEVENSQFNRAPLVFLEFVTYRCNYGYSTTGEAGARRMKTIMCGANGEFEQDAPHCLPVKCGTPPSLAHGALQDISEASKINFASPALKYKCNRGWSTNQQDTAWAPYENDEFVISCLATGEFEPMYTCKNIDDCQYVACGRNGNCIDGDDPSGTHFDDYSCHCDSGYETVSVDSTVREGELTKTCKNINDCPLPLLENCGGLTDSGARRGTCIDLINDYDCLPMTGYEVKTLGAFLQVRKGDQSDTSGNKTCTPKICGAVPVVEHAASSISGGVNFDTPAWTYTCDDGYSLNGHADGNKQFEMRCTSSAVFTEEKVCKPVTCGAPHIVTHTSEDPEFEEMFFPQEVTYSCWEGYSTNAEASGPTTFKVDCQANGEKTSAEECPPVKCGTTPHHDHATFNDQKVFVYLEETTITCNEGYSIDHTPSASAKFYILPCLSSGSFGEEQECKKVSCHEPPEVSNADVDSVEKFYQDEAEYTLHDGYTLNRAPDGPKTFKISCKATAEFTATQEPKRVTCGAAPSREHATTPEATYFYQDVVTYSCNTGYSADGEASGPKVFDLNCKADGTYEGQSGCEPVKCGAVSVPEHSEQVEDASGSKHPELHFGQQARFRCNAGWSMDGVFASTLVHATASCLADGSIDYPALCKNMDDCATPENLCYEQGMHGESKGECVDKESPTGNHMEDFKCACNPGFEFQTSEDGHHFCANIPDCPEAAPCQPGSCTDLVLDYECICPEGYYEGKDVDGIDDVEGSEHPHSCLPVECGTALELDHATCAREGEKILFDHDPVEYTCKEGYTLSAVAHSEAAFQVACQSDKSFSTPPPCLAVECGILPVVQNAMFASGIMTNFPEEHEYSCEDGYSSDQEPPSGSNQKFSTKCRSDGTLTELKECKPIRCPAIPSQDFVTINHGGHEMFFPEEVSTSCSAGYALQEHEHDNIAYTISCSDKGELVYSHGGEGCTAINCGDRPAPSNSDITGGTLFGDTVEVSCHEGYSVNQQCVESAYSYDFACEASGSFSEYHDCKHVQCPVPAIVLFGSHEATDVFFTDEVTYAAVEGYTTTGKADGPQSFAIRCESDCTYSGMAEFLPVECGAPPTKDHASNPGAERLFSEVEPYVCDGGYTLTGQATAGNSFELTCKADGEYHGDHNCKPVECGDVPVPQNSELTSSKTSTVFDEVSEFACMDGYSVDGKLGGTATFKTRCMADGSHSVHAGCHNINDCESNKCGSVGTCVDFDPPKSGSHLDNYECQCSKGYYQITEDGHHKCNNPDDCPDGACEPGSCNDLLDDYECHCPPGYDEKENPKEQLPHDCLPRKCGTAPSIDNAATTAGSKDFFFDAAPPSYECDEGHSLDHAYGGETKFDLPCEASGGFATLPTCHPVRCSTAPLVEHADYDKNTLFVFKGVINYQCHEGYTVSGFADGKKTFDVDCLKDGTFTRVFPCKPVQCKSVPIQKHAEYSKGFRMKFPQSLQVTCKPGHALDIHKHDEIDYTVSCGADGKLHFSNDAGCKPIDCGMPQNMEHAAVTGTSVFNDGRVRIDCDDGYSTDQTTLRLKKKQFAFCQASGQLTEHTTCKPIRCGEPEAVGSTEIVSGGVKVFKDEVTYQLANGYTLNGEAGGEKNFKISCQADGAFTDVEAPMPVSCGNAPQRSHAKANSDKAVFPNKIAYSCDIGFTLNGQATGEKSFDLSCNADGSYSGPDGCEPVECGAVEAISHADRTADKDGGKLTSLHFGQQAHFECKAGFSTDGGHHSDLLDIIVTCHPDGSLHYPAECHNNNDCLSKNNLCATHGHCVDRDDPTGNHKDDFHCECDDGFREKVTEEGGSFTKACVDIVDCPASACQPGTCEDLLNSYQCHCANGYLVGQSEEHEHDCVPKECGSPPEVQHAATDVAETIFYNSHPVEYACVEGHTLDAVAGSDPSFTVACLASGSFAHPPECKPVSCGNRPSVAHSAANVQQTAEVTFAGKVRYDCDEGYSTDSTLDSSAAQFEAVCEKDGLFDGVHVCEKIVCAEEVPDQPNAEVIEVAERLKFEETASATCHAGYALDKDSHSDNHFQIECLANGDLSIPDVHCVAIDCGGAPEIEHGIVAGATLFEEALTATAVEGYSLDGSPGGDKTFDFRCLATGKFGPRPFPAFERVACEVPTYLHVEKMEKKGSAALLQVNGSTGKQHLAGVKFGDGVEYTCKNGYHAHVSSWAHVSDPKSFSLTCGANGHMLAAEGEAGIACVPVSCEVAAGAGTDFILHSGSRCRTTTGQIIRPNVEGDVVACQQLCRTLDSCTAVMIFHSGSNAGKCTLMGGSFKEAVSYTEDVRDCYERDQGSLSVPVTAQGESLPLVRTFGHPQTFSCILGFSLDGAPDGDTQFEEECMADGSLSEAQRCKDVDYCANHRCTSDGKCVDGLLGYNCDCNEGFRVELVDGATETCTQIDECVELNGHDNCQGEDMWGTCDDDTSTYKCSCKDGYEMVKTDQGLEACTPVVCEAPGLLEHTQSSSETHMVFGDVLVYTCDTGYTLNGEASGDISFEVECKSDATTTSPQTCEPINCGNTVDVEHAEKDATSLVFPEEATYTCETGYTLTGSLTGTQTFTVQCDSDGSISDTLTCLPVACGIAPGVANAETSQETIYFPNHAQYHCVHGWTLTGEAGAETSFESACGANSDFGPLSVCLPVACGRIPNVEFAEYTHMQHLYPEQSEVMCRPGYTVDGTIQGLATFQVSCESDGNFGGMRECQKVSCGHPEDTDKAVVEDKSERFFRDTARWTCMEGFSVDGTLRGGLHFIKQCQSSGDYGSSSPSNCADIDYCIGTPCGANGLCSDAGAGAVSPGYTCECFEGYNLVETDGQQRCVKDSCNESPCGRGGTCTDLSQHAEGMYSCECDPGYTLREIEADKPFCEHNSCGRVPVLPNVELEFSSTLPLLDVALWYVSDEIEMDPMYNVPVLHSLDKVTFTCAEGYSTDGSTHVESQTFTVDCLTSGIYNPPLMNETFCVKVECDNSFIPEISHTVVLNSTAKYYYGDAVTFACAEGFTIGGEVGAERRFELDCLASGEFTHSDEAPVCAPIKCPVEQIQYAVASHEAPIRYGLGATYDCDTGYYVGGAVSEDTMSFHGYCGMEGALEFDVDHPECLPANCGVPSHGDHSQVLVPTEEFFLLLELANTERNSTANSRGLVTRLTSKRQSHISQKHNRKESGAWMPLEEGVTLTYGQIAVIQCEDGYTVGGVVGGIDHYEVSCHALGEFSGGSPTHGPCEAPEYSVEGSVFDHQLPTAKVEEASLTFFKGGMQVASVSSVDSGRFQVNLPKGSYIVEAYKAGYHAVNKTITVAGAVQHGQGADVGLSKDLSLGEYRVVLEWGGHNRDLHSWVYFDRNFAKYVAYSRKRTVGMRSGITMILDRDDVNGHETITINGMGECKQSCLIKFHVDDYAPRGNGTGESDATVTVYHGDDEVAASYTIPADVGGEQGLLSARGHTIFTLDATNGQLFPGDYSRGPFIDARNRGTGEVDWSASMDGVGWSKVPPGSVVYSIGANDFANLHHISAAKYYAIQPPSATFEIHEQAWHSKLHDGEYAGCPEGSWISGLYREGSKLDNTQQGGWQITRVQCVQWTDVSAWGECEDVEIFRDGNEGEDAAKCPSKEDGTHFGLVGFYSEGADEYSSLQTLHKAKCCSFPKDLVAVPEDKRCSRKMFCTGVWNANP
jgi:CUB/sushi domain-containing protein